MKITEEILHFAWQNGYFDRASLQTVDGEKLEVISVGIKNLNSGPDFFAARIKLGDYIWAGNVEIHLKSSDWYKHRHDKDAAYNNVILHVVAEHDIESSKHPDYNLKTLVLPLSSELFEKYGEFYGDKTFIACEKYVPAVHSFVKSHMINRVAVERLERKAAGIIDLYRQLQNDWNSAFYVTVARYFGAPHNSDAMENLAKSLPLKILAKHKGNIFQIEALLFGASGLLNKEVDDEYFNKLKKEWEFLSSKYGLISQEAHNWKFMRMRPANFPTVRIAQFASLINKSSFLFSKIIHSQKLSDVIPLFEAGVSQYWETHYVFGKESRRKSKQTGKSFIDRIMINAVVPVIFAYGIENGNSRMKDKAITWLDLIDAEANSVVEKYKKLNFPVKSALFSQGLLSLKQEYCEKHRCLNCLIGYSILKKS